MRLQQEILAELHTLERVRDMLDVVDIVLGFLSSGGGNADQSLGEYVERVLKMKTKKLSQKVILNSVVRFEYLYTEVKMAVTTCHCTCRSSSTASWGTLFLCGRLYLLILPDSFTSEER